MMEGMNRTEQVQTQQFLDKGFAAIFTLFLGSFEDEGDDYQRHPTGPIPLLSLRSEIKLDNKI